MKKRNEIPQVNNNRNIENEITLINNLGTFSEYLKTSKISIFLLEAQKGLKLLGVARIE